MTKKNSVWSGLSLKSSGEGSRLRRDFSRHIMCDEIKFEIGHPITTKQRCHRQAGALYVVARVRTVALGKILNPSFLQERSNSHWEESSFLYRKSSSQPIRYLTISPSNIQLHGMAFLSGISFITELFLDKR